VGNCELGLILYEFYMRGWMHIYIYIYIYIYISVWSRIWHEQQWTLMVGNPVAWYWYERKYFMHGCE